MFFFVARSFACSFASATCGKGFRAYHLEMDALIGFKKLCVPRGSLCVCVRVHVSNVFSFRFAATPS